MKKHYGDYTDEQLRNMSAAELVAIIQNLQDEDNFIIMSDSYKMTHHLLVPDGIEETYSGLESRGGDMPYSILCLLQYYLKKYFAGVRITPQKIEEARKKNIAHFGFDCFNDKMWYHIWNEHGGRLPLEIKAVPEGTPVAVKNIIMTIRNTDKKCSPLTNISETTLMKLWAPNTVATYARLVKELIVKYHALSSDAPQWLIDFMHHDFGYRGVSSEESARILGAAALISFKGTDTLGACVLAEKYYDCPMAGYSVIASEHSVHCSYDGNDADPEGYRTIINKVKNDPLVWNANPASGVIILSLVSDTKNIYNVCHRILPGLRDEFIGWTNKHGIPIKVVVRPDSGDAEMVLFGLFNDSKVDTHYASQVMMKVAKHMNIDLTEAQELVEKGIFNILFDQFGSTVNSKGFRVFHPQIGCLQGDGVNYKLMASLYERMISVKIDIMNLVFGSGGKYLQAHDRDEQKYAIKATHVIINGVGINIEKNPVTDAVKKSKTGYCKLVRTERKPGMQAWEAFKTVQSTDPDFDKYEDVLVSVFRDGEILVEYTFDDVRKNAEIEMPVAVAA